MAGRPAAALPWTSRAPKTGSYCWLVVLLLGRSAPKTVSFLRHLAMLTGSGFFARRQNSQCRLMKAVAVPVADECRLLQYYHAVPVPPYLCRFALTHRRRRRLLSSLVILGSFLWGLVHLSCCVNLYACHAPMTLACCNLLIRLEHARGDKSMRNAKRASPI